MQGLPRPVRFHVYVFKGASASCTDEVQKHESFICTQAMRLTKIILKSSMSSGRLKHAGTKTDDPSNSGVLREAETHVIKRCLGFQCCREKELGPPDPLTDDRLHAVQILIDFGGLGCVHQIKSISRRTSCLSGFFLLLRRAL